MATTALVAEILIVGLEAEAVVALLVFAVFGWQWVDFGGLHDWVTPLMAGAFAIAYVLGIVCDRLADSLFAVMRTRRKTSEDVAVMRMAVLAANSDVSAFLEYQRSRIRIARGTMFTSLIGAGAALWALSRNDASTRATAFVPAALGVAALASAVTFRLIDSAYVKRLSDSYELLDAKSKPSKKGRQRVAAIAFRERSGALEFLLVRLRRKRPTRHQAWTFPKGKVEPDRDAGDHVVAVRREAREEAGIIVGSEPELVGTYRYGFPDQEDESEGVPVEAYLLRVDRQTPPREKFRKPHWFTETEARERLARGRPAWQAKEHRRILNDALEQLQRERPS